MRKLLCALLGIFGLFIVPAYAALPDGYTELEYIESTGTQYIDTGFSPDANTRVDYKGQLLQYASSVPLLGARLGADNPARFLPLAWKSGANTGRTVYGDKDVELNISTSTIYTGTFNPAQGKTIINGITYDISGGNFTKIEDNNFYLFATSGYVNNLYNSVGRIWYVKIWDNNTLVRDMVPAKNSSGKIGMYDTVNNRFYTNAGTGEFVAGAPVTTNSCRNLFNGAVEVGSGIENTNYRLRSKQLIPVEAGKTYILSAQNASSEYRYVLNSGERPQYPFGSNTYGYTGNPTDWKSVGTTIRYTATKNGYLGIIFSKNNESTITISEFERDIFPLGIQLEQGSTATPYQPYNPSCGCDGTVVNYASATGTGVQNGTPTPDNPIYPTFYTQGNMVLRKVGDYADTYDATTGKITRRIGVKVFNGTETWGRNSYSGFGYRFYTVLSSNRDHTTLLKSNMYQGIVYQGGTSGANNTVFWAGITESESGCFVRDDRFTTVADWKQFLADQYAAGTPVTVWYPLAEETTEDWTETSYCSAPIKIATTKYNESAFSPLNTALANAISVVDSVVSNTITQAGRIADLQTQKQTRPADDPTDANNAENCPAGKKCLLVEDASGIPHWYEIVESYSSLPDGYTELEYIRFDGSQYIITNYIMDQTSNPKVELKIKNKRGVGFGSQVENTRSILDYSSQLYCGAGTKRLTYVLPNDDNIHILSGEYNTNTTVLSVYVDGVLQKSDEQPGSFSTNKFAFGTINGGSDNSKLSGDVYSFKVYQNNSLVLNLIPAKRNSDDVLGMYDTATNTFFTNAGDGEFIAGPVAE